MFTDAGHPANICGVRKIGPVRGYAQTLPESCDTVQMCPTVCRRHSDVTPTSFLPLKFVIDGLTRVGNITPDTFDGFTGRQSKDSENKSDTEHGKPLGHWLDLGQTNGPSGCRQDYKNIAFRWRGKPPPRPRTHVVFRHVTNDRHPES